MKKNLIEQKEIKIPTMPVKEMHGNGLAVYSSNEESFNEYLKELKF